MLSYLYVTITCIGARRGEKAGEAHGRKEPARFDSFRFRDSLNIGSVRFGLAIVLFLLFFFRFDAIRPAHFERPMVRSGSVPFGSAFGSGPFRN